jgi:hypothetical protein
VNCISASTRCESLSAYLDHRNPLPAVGASVFPIDFYLVLADLVDYVLAECPELFLAAVDVLGVLDAPEELGDKVFDGNFF